jgi:hypothetical protein
MLPRKYIGQGWPAKKIAPALWQEAVIPAGGTIIAPACLKI